LVRLVKRSFVCSDPGSSAFGSAWASAASETASYSMRCPPWAVATRHSLRDMPRKN